MSENEVILNIKNNPQYNKIILDQLFLTLVRITGIASPVQLHRLISKLGIFKVNIAILYCYFVQKRAATRSVAINDLKEVMSDKTVFYNVKNLKRAGLLKNVIVSRGSKRGGPKSEVIAIHNYDDEDIQRALEDDRKRVTPFYDVTRKVQQIVLTEYVEPKKLSQFSYRHILSIISNLEMSGFYKPDIAHQVCTILKEENGIGIVY